MRFYRVHFKAFDVGSAGFEFFTNEAAARKALRRDARDARMEHDPSSLEVIDVEPTKAGILRALQRYASHPDNG